MMRLVRKIFRRFPPKVEPPDEAALREERRRIDEELNALIRQRRQRETIYLLEEEVNAITAGRFRRGTP